MLAYGNGHTYMHGQQPPLLPPTTTNTCVVLVVSCSPCPLQDVACSMGWLTIVSCGHGVHAWPLCYLRRVVGRRAGRQHGERALMISAVANNCTLPQHLRHASPHAKAIYIERGI